MTVQPTGEHVLVVGGGMELPALLRQQRTGVRTSVLCQLSLLPRLQEVSGHERVLSLRADATDAEWLATARQLHTHDPITRIATFGERDQNRAAVIGAALGLATHDPATVAAVHDKSVMRTLLATAGVEDVRWAVHDRAEQLVKWLQSNEGAWVVKPIDGSGSAGVSVVETPEQAERAYQRCVGSAHTGQAGACEVLVEEYLPGKQISVESFSEDGEHCMVATTRKYSDTETLVELGHVVPAGLTPDIAEAVARHVPLVLDALGVRDGVCHTEIVLTDRGPRVIETHLRLAGDEIPYLVRDATGVDLVQSLVRQTLGDRVLPSVRRALAESDGPAQAIWFGVAPCPGTLLRIDGLTEARALNGVDVVQEIPNGGAVGALEDSGSRPMWARASADDSETALRRARDAVASCTLVVSVPATSAAELTDYL